MDTENAVLITGGCGVVGQQVAHAICRRHPELPLIIAGRNPAKAEALARELTNADTAKLDTGQLSPLGGLRPRAILAAVNDPHDYLLMDTILTGIPYVDITRWTERVRGAVSLAGRKPLSAPIMLSSGWMAGVASVVAVALSRQLDGAR